ncbi:Uncharacterised protein [Salmonella enterica subsp. enterica serovar Bovismorbificans]|uniref:Uncharacterized protein n=1 Tax=Salmonella enterica subsp. enterica serovar Bovismorbificans TaxID=58097 RepID=A0A655BKZ2_SALET|nr:Uncharacterised protein [Salmonella enterica subsp. enterica serovar Bovismorbificans]CNT60139.1 Uncharacterised protein [Salmonella enterica subsp. enterica serovar Bovismorbificans]CNT77243.1 Uncharacterised protein [Salmonella enterica subsp. enterica serovar Bovismorbificans]
MTAIALDMTPNRVHRAFTDHPVIDINPAHAALRGKRNKGGMKRLHIAFTQVKALFGEDHNAAALRRFVGQRSELRGVSQRAFVHPSGGNKIGRLAVAERDSAGFIQQ